VLASDVRERAVYPAVVYPGIALAVATAPILGSSVVDALLGAASSGGLFAGFYLLARLRYGPGALGAGDVSAAALLGAVVGLQRLFPALALVSLIGAAIAVVAGLRAHSLRASFAYAPALCLAALVTTLFRTP
jgi:prepilin signal peptidase PulO-like enzyme (type II secretory pathway)